MTTNELPTLNATPLIGYKLEVYRSDCPFCGAPEPAHSFTITPFGFGPWECDACKRFGEVFRD